MEPRPSPRWRRRATLSVYAALQKWLGQLKPDRSITPSWTCHDDDTDWNTFVDPSTSQQPASPDSHGAARTARGTTPRLRVGRRVVGPGRLKCSKVVGRMWDAQTIERMERRERV